MNKICGLLIGFVLNTFKYTYKGTTRNRYFAAAGKFRFIYERGIWNPGAIKVFR